MTARRDCEGCRLTLMQACVHRRAARLCGLCRLLPPEQVARYVERWRPDEALRTADEARG
jgi:hypothetical protein